MSDELTKLVNDELDNDCPFCPDLVADNEAKNDKILEARKQIQTLLQMNRNQEELLEERDEEIRLERQKCDEIVKHTCNIADETGWVCLYIQENQRLKEQLIQANLDIIRLEKNKEDMQDTIDNLQDQLLILKSNQSKFSG